MSDSPLPISRDILYKRQEIPAKIAELSYKDETQAINFLRLWGEKKAPISELHKEVTDCLDNL